jgi:hypothetical protein
MTTAAALSCFGVNEETLMIVFGICAGPSSKFELICQPALERLAPEAEVVVLRSQKAIASAYNTILDAASRRSDLEGVVLLHDDVELLDPHWRAKLSKAFESGADIVGVIGGRGKGGMSWWTREHQSGRVVEPGRIHDMGTTLSDVDVVDGVFIAMSPWAVRHLRFEVGRYPGFHGYDADICIQARSIGRRVALAPIEILHHTRGAFGTKKSYEDWIRAQLQWQVRWQKTRMPVRAILKLRLRCLPVEVRLRPSVAQRRRGLRS